MTHLNEKTRNSRRWFQRLAVPAMVVAAAATTFSAVARDPGTGPGPGKAPGPERPMMHMLHDLDLSDAQRAQIRDILMSQRGPAEGGHHGFGEGPGPMGFAELDPDSAQYNADVKAMADKAAAEAAARATQMAEVQGQIYQVLTAEQRSKVAADIKDMDAKKGAPGDKPGMRLPPVGGPALRILDDMELSDDQWLKVHHLLTDSRKKAASDEMAMHKLLGSIATLSPDASDRNKQVEKVSQQVGDAARAKVMQMADLQKDLYSVLTPDQRSEFEQALKARKPGRGPGPEAHMMGKPHDRGMGKDMGPDQAPAPQG